MVSRRVVLAALALLLAVPLLLGGRCAGSEPTFQPTATGDGPSYLDPRLEEILRELIQRPTGELTAADLLSITELKADGKGIASLAGLEYLENLESLILDANPLEDLAPLGQQEAAAS